MDIYGKLENVRNTQEVSALALTFTKKVPKGVLTIGNRWVVTLNHHSGEALFDRNGFKSIWIQTNRTASRRGSCTTKSVLSASTPI